MLDINSLETRLVGCVTEKLLEARSQLHQVVELCGELDCLLALATVSREGSWVRPKLVRGSRRLKIQEGRHPLQELTCSQFISNDTLMGRGEEGGTFLHLLTGPNSSGKSIYLKQVGLIVFLAHLGCWVPASSATVRVAIQNRYNNS